MRVKIEGVWLEVEFDYHPARRGARDGFGVPLEPDDPADAELTAVYVGCTDILPLLGMKMVQRIEEEVLKDSVEWKQERYFQVAV